MPGPTEPKHETGPAVTRNLGNRFARQFAGAAIEVERLVGDAELAKRDRRAAEAVGRDRVAPGAQIGQMNFADEVGPALAEDLGAVLVAVEIALDRPGLRPCTCVPIAPSASSTRSAR